MASCAPKSLSSASSVDIGSAPTIPRADPGGSPPVLASPKPLSTLLRRFACARLSQPCLPESCPGVSATLPSRPGEFHPEPLTDPDVILSHHPARATARRLPPSVENLKAPPVTGWLAPNVGDLPPSLHEHYTRFITSTGQSAPLRRIGTFSLAGSPLVLSPLASPARFSSSVREPK